MVALVTLTEKQKGKLTHLLNSLNLGTADANVGDVFVAWLDGNAPTLTQRELDRLVHLLNNLNLETHHQKFGNLFVSLLSANATAVAKALTLRDIYQIEHMLDRINLGLTHAGFSSVFIEALSAVANAEQVVPTPTKTIAAKTGVTAAAGGTVAFADMFDAGTGGAVAADFNYEVTPATGSQGGAVEPATGVLTLDADATGTVTVKATAKPDQTVTGSPATCSITVS